MSHSAPVQGGERGQRRPLATLESGQTDQSGEGLGQLTSDVSFVVNEQLDEEGLVHEPTDSVACLEVGGLAVFDEVECLIQLDLGLGEVGLTGSDQPLGFAESVANALLLSLELLDRDGAGVVRLQDLAALVFELRHSLTLPIYLTSPGGGPLLTDDG